MDGVDYLTGRYLEATAELARLRAENERLRGLLHEAWAMLQVWDEPRENDLCIRIERTLAGVSPTVPIPAGSQGTAGKMEEPK